jgi:uncharacterized membrane protein YgcG
VFGGENEHRSHLADVIIFDLKTAHWTSPEVQGTPPRGRARHSAVIHDDKLFVSGGMTGHDNAVLDDICYLDLKTWTWSRPWKFVPRYDHSTWIWRDRLWVSGGMTDDMERTSDIWWLDLKGIPAFEGANPDQDLSRSSMYSTASTLVAQPGATGGAYAANSSSVQVNPGYMVQRNPAIAPGSISSLRFISDPNLPVQNVGYHFHVFSSACLLDFVTPATLMSASETSLSAFDLDSLRWQKLADGKDIFDANYRWHYCCLDSDGTHAWLLGCPNSAVRNLPDAEEYLSDVLHLDLRKLGLLGNKMALESRSVQHIPTSDSRVTSHLSAIGADLARTFDLPPEQGSGADFIITANPDDDDDYDDEYDQDSHQKPSNASKPIHVHRFILSSRWPHFARLYAAQMSEFHTKKMHIPEPYAAVRAFLYYLYTDSIAPSSITNTTTPSPSLEDVAGMLVMSNIYDMPRLHHLCVARLVRELDIQHAPLIFDCASVAQESWLKRRAATFCMQHWGRIVRTEAFRRLSRAAMLELCEEVDAEGRVVGGDELEAVGALGGARLINSWPEGRKRRLNSENGFLDGNGGGSGGGGGIGGGGVGGGGGLDEEDEDEGMEVS